MTERARVLVVEDIPTQAELARALLAGLGHDVQVVGAASRALGIAREWQPDAVLLDIEPCDYDGFELMKQLRAQGFEGAVIVVTANGSVNNAVEAMRGGALDFIVKPYAKARLQVTLGNALELRQARAVAGRERFHGLIGASEAMKAVYRTIEAVGASRASVFITGESGTGKKLAAEAVHKASARAGGAFVALNCGAMPRDLLESEVFGHVRGGFPGATADRVGAAKAADGGTLFLDEIGEMSLEMQVKLLRFVRTGTFQPVGSSRNETVDVRFVAATNRDPLDELRAGRFHEDLFYRLHVVPIELPPLRERGDDVLLIARHMLGRISREEGRSFRGFGPGAERLLRGYSWPGNVRQLRDVIRNVVALNDGEWFEPAMLPPALLRAGGAAERMPGRIAPPPITAVLEHAEPELNGPGAAAEPAPALLPPEPPGEVEIMPLAEMERRLVLAALDRTAQDVPRAAALLQINPSTIYRKLQAWRAAGLVPT